MRRFLALLMTLLLLPLASFAEETDPVPTQEPTPVPTPTLTPAPTPVPTPTLEELWDQYAEARFCALPPLLLLRPPLPRRGWSPKPLRRRRPLRPADGIQDQSPGDG